MANGILLQEGSAGSTGQTGSYFRRRTSRVQAGEWVYAFWSCGGLDGLSHVRDLSLGGLFIESPLHENLDASVMLHFLVDEGQIRANAVVRHVRAGKGLGLKLIAINDQDCQRLAGLIRRVQSSPEGCCTEDGADL